ncbi:alpha-2,8-polysialyltransferase family protein [Testudinibacter sp. P27/CKL/0425]
MSKFKKLVFNPLQFFHDSWVFSGTQPKTLNKIENLFFISNLGQLAQVEALIKKEKFKNCFLIILYTKKNLRAPKMTAGHVLEELFLGLDFLELPLSPNTIEIKRLVYLNNTYNRLIKSLKPNKIFMLSFEKHYALLIANARLLGVKVNLVEEGSGTYKYENESEANKAIISNLTNQEKKTAFFIQYFPFFKSLKHALVIPKYFDNLYVSFPELLENTFNFRRSSEFFLYDKDAPISNKMKNISESYSLSDNDIFFLNQRYSFLNELYIDKLLYILKSYSVFFKTRVFIKLHPRDTPEFKKVLREKIKFLSPDIKIFLLDEPDFLIEPLIFLVKPKIILGLSSTALIYTIKLSEKTRCISIYPTLKVEMQTEADNEQDFLTPDNHFEILSNFKHVEILNNLNEIN